MVSELNLPLAVERQVLYWFQPLHQADAFYSSQPVFVAFVSLAVADDLLFQLIQIGERHRRMDFIQLCVEATGQYDIVLS